ncbi:type I-B CRISPR-associated endonuclease Cas1b [Candidatus Absconditicoccus praedator]|uniref:type I-B CRISPR-associated endonuclease Cas1b n=1 Tax=Candidatus Absconditicoccus praedator TaxID=2735562 RepID=UPI001E327652|nr:type I-B CRISPR-associated endonuclease Cas1b [Candidatus Absconditicoccus praedator]UFX82691.1 type I-B CRISPR-associated endonuclease Cas1 [Candidatus Absconditicoccus praedator]
MENKNLYITQSGQLSRKDNTLFFQNESTQKVIPIANIEQIFCLGEVSINSKLLNFLTQNMITVHFFNYYGYYSGSYYPRENYVSGKLFVNQVNYYQNTSSRLEIASNIVEGIGNNMISSLRHYQRHHKNVEKYIHKIQEMLVGIKSKKDINQVLFVEGSLWDVYYNSFKEFLPEEFVLNKRVKRPPDNPINALISFGNSVLYTYVLTKIYHTQLNPTISYLHEPFQRRFSLALDVSEVFKIPLVYGNIFNMVNRGVLKVEKHFMHDVNYAVLNEEGRRLFLRYWDERVQKTVDHPKLKRKVSYGSLIKFDCYKLIKHIMGEEQFVPFSMEKNY